MHDTNRCLPGAVQGVRRRRRVPKYDEARVEGRLICGLVAVRTNLPAPELAQKAESCIWSHQDPEVARAGLEALDEVARLEEGVLRCIKVEAARVVRRGPALRGRVGVEAVAFYFSDPKNHVERVVGLVLVCPVGAATTTTTQQIRHLLEHVLLREPGLRFCRWF